jgi:hypothetical protein
MRQQGRRLDVSSRETAPLLDETVARVRAYVDELYPQASKESRDLTVKVYAARLASHLLDLARKA